MRWLLILALLLFTAPLAAHEGHKHEEPPPEPAPAPVAAEEPEEACSGGTCVPDEDLKQMVKVLREKQCLQSTIPTFELDPVTVVVDKEGRVYFSGAEPHPYTVKMTWCNYTMEAKGKVDVVAAMDVPPIWGFRFRPKAYIGVLPLEAVNVWLDNQARELAGEETESVTAAGVFDAGLMVDFLYYDWLNLNVAVGYHSFGIGPGVDITENFGLYLGYANTWGDWHHNVNFAAWFSFYNP